MKLLYVILGGGLGAASRFIITLTLTQRLGGGFAWGTAVVNITGCFFIGLAAGFLERAQLASSAWLFLVTGFLGGFTTFSTFSLETVELLRSGGYGRAVLNAGVNLAGGLMATIAGLALVLRAD